MPTLTIGLPVVENLTVDKNSDRSTEAGTKPNLIKI